MTILTVTTPAHWPKPFCASAVVSGGWVLRHAPILTRSVQLVGYETAELARYWRGKGAAVELSEGEGSGERVK